MNNKIKELAADARGQMVVLTTVDEALWKQHEEFVEKFAQLIIGECARIARVYSEEGVEYHGGDAIKEHFGIKE